MEKISYTAARAKLADLMDKVNDRPCAVIITRQGGKPAVLLSLDVFNSYVETDYSFSNYNNAMRISKAVRDLKSGRGRVHKLIR